MKSLEELINAEYGADHKEVPEQPLTIGGVPTDKEYGDGYAGLPDEDTGVGQVIDGVDIDKEY